MSDIIIITCPECEHFVAENPDTSEQELQCLAECVDFLKQLSSGQTMLCKKAKLKGV